LACDSDAAISTYRTLSFRKLDQNGTLERSFFDFLNGYIPWEKLLMNYEKPLKMGFFNVATNKKF